MKSYVEYGVRLVKIKHIIRAKVKVKVMYVSVNIELDCLIV